MKPLSLFVGGAALALATAAQALTPWQADYLTKADAVAESRLAEAGVDLASPLRVKAHLGGDGTLTNARVVSSSGSRDVDEAAVKALRKLRLGAPPAEFAGRSLTLTLGGGEALASR